MTCPGIPLSAASSYSIITFRALHLPEESKHPGMVLKALHNLVLAFRCTFLDFDFLFYATLEDSFLEGCVGLPQYL